MGLIHNIYTVGIYFIISEKEQYLITLNPIDILLWTFRRNHRDIINLYNSLSRLMQITSGGNMLNFGYWLKNEKTPNDAQKNLCKTIGMIADLENAKNIVDVGSGFSAPAMFWQELYPSIEICCVNINFKQLLFSNVEINNIKTSNHIHLINSTSSNLPFAKNSIDRIISLESAQHFKSLSKFITSATEIMKSNGVLVIAIPIISEDLNLFRKFRTLGILSFTWTSEHYSLNNILDTLKNQQLKIQDIIKIGSDVYDPLAEYYINNRKILKNLILNEYNHIVEYILYKSIIKMRKLSKYKIIDYVIIKAIKTIES